MKEIYRGIVKDVNVETWKVGVAVKNLQNPTRRRQTDMHCSNLIS